MQIRNGHFFLGDCFDHMRTLADGSVDLVLCDLPYGTTQNPWDSVLPLDALWREYWRVCRPGAAVVLTASQPFTSVLGASQIAALRYEWVWQKTTATGHLNAKRQPMKKHEVVLVFCRSAPPYYPQGLVPHNKVVRRGSNGANFGTSGTSNFQEWTNYPRSIVEFALDGDGFHPTQKPVALFEYLIRTYSQPGQLVLDNTAGSGTTAIAAEAAGRPWICIEKDPDYYWQAIARLIDDA